MSKERTIDVKAQANLSPAHTFQLCLKGIAHRFTRSALTLAVVVLAVAFFMFLLCENSFVSSTAAGTAREDLTRRLAARTLARLYNQPSSLALSRRLAEAAQTGDSAALQEYSALTGLDRSQLHALAEDCRTEQVYLDFFERIPVGNLVILAHNRRGREILRNLADHSARLLFAERIRPMLDVRIPGGMDDFFDFCARYPEFEAQLLQFQKAWHAAQDELAARTAALSGGLDPAEWLAQASDADLQRWADTAQTLNFSLPAEDVTVIRDQLAYSDLRHKLIADLNATETRDLWRRVFRERRRTAAEEKLLRLADERALEVLGDRYQAEALANVAATERYHLRLLRLEKTLGGMVDSGSAPGTLSGRQWFLLFISFLVCIVGITNAMLMSITERFREIATMKCLGAIDRFILTQFMMEAGLQGVAGGLLGMLLGFAAALLKSTAMFGTAAFTYWPGWVLAGAGLFSICTGILLSVLASTYPSWAASRMAPMEAMRVE